MVDDAMRRASGSVIKRVVLATLLFCAAVSTVFVVIYVRSKP
jgi:hypothetical protein